MSLLGGGTTAAVGRSGPCSSIDAAIRGNGGRSMAPKAKACMRNAAVATAKTNSAMDTLLSLTLAPAALAREHCLRNFAHRGVADNQQDAITLAHS